MDSDNITCSLVNANQILIPSALNLKDVAPEKIQFRIESLINPTSNLVTGSFEIITTTYDGYLVDNLTAGMEVNFYCIFPCQTCEKTNPSKCLSCYKTSTDYIYLFQEKCYDDCPTGMYEIPYNIYTQTPPTCGFCEFPCATCGTSAT